MSERTKQNEPLASAPAVSSPPDVAATGEKAPPKPRDPQQPSVVTRAQIEQNPAKYDNAPPSVVGEPIPPVEDREPWPASKISFEDAKKAGAILARTKDPKSAGIYAAGTFVTARGVSVDPARLLARGEHFLRAFLADQDIELKLEK